jgi:hypothetical protein
LFNGKKSEFQFYPKAGDRVDFISSTFFLFAVFELLTKVFMLKKGLLGLITLSLFIF